MNKNQNRNADTSMCILTILLVLIGLIMLYSASYAQALGEGRSPYHYIFRQSCFAVLGLISMYIISFIDYKWMKLFSIPLYMLTIFLLLLVHFFGVEANYAKRWLEIGPIQFQPSEIAKTAVILLFATICVKNEKNMQSLTKGLLPFIILLGLIAMFTLPQPHISATIIIICTGFAIIFVAGIKITQIAIPASLIVVFLWWFIGIMGYAKTRIEVWKDPFIDFIGSGWQGSQSFITIGSGGLMGVGFGQGRQKHLYLPEPSNDFIFPVICEEIGFVGAMIVIILFTVFIARGYMIAYNARDKFGRLLVVGIISKVAIQTIVNLWVVTGLFPITGASLPFFSYGGTALLIQLSEIGILLNVSRHSKKVKA